MEADENRNAAGAARRPLGEDGRYLIPREELPPGFAERVGIAGDAVAPRAASTVVLVRDAPGGVEALLLRRPRRSSFAGGAWVFPGGAVDPADACLPSEAALPAPDDWWSARMGVSPADARGYVVAALREAWEETGILLSDPPVEPVAVRAARRELLAGTASLAEILAAEGVRLDARDVVYIAHWITPEPEPRRYDTRFFLAPVPIGAECDLVGDELREARWVRPEEADRAFRAGELRLLPPTAHTLQRLRGHASVDALRAGLSAGPVPTILPRMRLDPAGVVIEID